MFATSWPFSCELEKRTLACVVVPKQDLNIVRMLPVLVSDNLKKLIYIEVVVTTPK
jgi:hypothetical protein